MIKIDDMPRRIAVGRTMDNGYGALQIDCKEWLKRYPQLTTYRIEVKRPDGEMYFADTTFKDGILTWNINAADTAIAGDGEFQVVAIGADGERKTSSHPIMFVSDIIAGTASDTLPEANKAWTDRVIEETRAHADQAANSAQAAQQAAGMAAEDAVNKWLDEHPEATTTVKDGSLDENKFTDDAKKRIVKDYVTPEMFGTVGGEDDYEAIQACVNYAIANKVPVYFARDYFVSQSIVIEGSHPWLTVGGIQLEGNNRRLVVTENIPALIVRGNAHTIKDLIVTHASKFFDDSAMKYTYTAALVQIQAKAENTCFICTKNKFINVTCKASADNRSNDLYTSIGFEFVIQGESSQKSYAYENSFVACSCKNVGTAIKVTENEYSDGCNGNSFDVSAWAPDCYLDGITGGCRFSGLVQSTHVLKTDSDGNVANQYLVKNIGSNNVFDNTWYDYNDSINKSIPMIYDGSGKYNKFTQSIFDRGMEPSVYNEYGGGVRHVGKVVMPVNLVSQIMPVLTIMPCRNSFNAIENATIKADGVRVCDPSYAWDRTKYPEFSGGLPTNVAPIFHDDSAGRRAGFFQNNTDTVKTIEIEFTPLGIIAAMFIYFSGSNELEVNLIMEYPTATAETHKFEVVVGNMGVFASFSNIFTASNEVPTKATIQINILPNSNNFYISQVAGYMISQTQGVV